MVEFNNYLTNGQAMKRAHGGATASQLSYYVLAALKEDKPSTILINAGINNLTKKWGQTEEEIAKEIVEIVKISKREGVRDIFVSSIIHRPKYQSKIEKINQLLRYNAEIYGYQFIDNEYIRDEHLKKDGVHLNKEGVCILANNFLSYLNRSILLPFHNVWGNWLSKGICTQLHTTINYKDDDNAICEYYETVVLTFYLFNLFIGVGSLANLIQFNRLNIRPSERIVLDTLPGVSDPKLISYNKSNPNSHDNWKHVENVDNIFCKNEEDFLPTLKDLRMKNAKKVIIGSPNVNGISNKIDALKASMPGYIDILIIIESKIK